MRRIVTVPAVARELASMRAARLEAQERAAEYELYVREKEELIRVARNDWESREVARLEAEKEAERAARSPQKKPKPEPAPVHWLYRGDVLCRSQRWTHGLQSGRDSALVTCPKCVKVATKTGLLRQKEAAP